MMRFRIAGILLLSFHSLSPFLHGQEPEDEVGQGQPAVRPADELFWTPTLEQAVAMAAANDVPIFVMGYSLVGDGSTYTKFGDDCASAVF